MGTSHRILVVDDHPVVRQGLAAMIDSQARMQVCGEAASVREALEATERLAPDIVIVDIRLADGHGIELVKKLRARHPAVRSLVVSAYDEDIYAERCLRAGACGYVGKAELQDEIVGALKAVIAGQRYLSPSMTQKLVARLGGAAPGGDPVERLSDRELEVFDLIGQGLTTADIAQRLRLSVHTIETHRENIRHKLDVASSHELTRRAIAWTLLNA